MLLIIDANNLLHRSAHSLRELEYNGQATGAVFGFLEAITYAKSAYNQDIIVVWDGPDSQTLRKSIDPTYKGNRPKAAEKNKEHYESVKSQRKLIFNLLRKIGVLQLVSSECEADDVIAHIVEKNPDIHCRIMSNDGDLCSLMTNKNCDIVMVKSKRTIVVTRNNIDEVTGIPNPEMVKSYKALVGDPADNIKGIPGIGKKRALAILQETKDGCSYENTVFDAVGKDSYAVFQDCLKLVEFYPAKFKIYRRPKSASDDEAQGELLKLGMVNFANERFQELMQCCKFSERITL